MIGSTTSVFNCSVYELRKIHNRAGNLTFVEEKELPFPVKRVYYLFDVPGGADRGAHAHREMHHLMIAVGGSFDVVLDDGFRKRIVFLNNPRFGLHILPGIWLEVINFSSGATSLNIVSTKYDPDDYIRDYQDFLSLKGIREEISRHTG